MKGSHVMSILKKAIRVVVFIALTLVILLTLNKVTITKDRYYKIRHDFNNMENDTMDVMILGSCHSYTSINPMRFWYNAGITAYNYALPSSFISTTYLQLKEALETQSPKIVFIETWGINSDGTYIETEDLYNYFIELTSHFPYSEQKKMVVDDFFDAELNPMITELDLKKDDFNKDRYAIMFPFLRYKNRILDGGLSEIDFNDSYEYTEEDLLNVQFNYEITTRIKQKGFLENPIVSGDVLPKDFKPIATTETGEISKMNLKYIDAMIDLCNEKNVDIVFYTSPYNMQEQEVERFNALNAYLSERKVGYFYLPKLIDYDYQNDFFDPTHLNIQGANKQTDYFLNYLKKNYHLPDKRSLEIPDWPDVYTEGL